MSKLEIEKSKLSKRVLEFRRKNREFNRQVEHWYAMLPLKIGGILLTGVAIGMKLK